MAGSVSFYPAHIVLGLILVVLQSTLLARLGGLDFLPVLVIHLSLQRNFMAGAVIVFCIGFLHDLLSGAPAGLHSLLYLTIHYLAHLLHRRLNLYHPIHQMLGVLLALLFINIVINRALGGPAPTRTDWVILGLAALLSPLIFKVFDLAESLQSRLARSSGADRA